MLNSSEWTSLYSLEYEAMIVESKIRESENDFSTKELFVVRNYMDKRMHELRRKIELEG